VPYTYADGVWTQTTAIPTVVTWDDVDDKPSAFPPSAHLHTTDDVTGLNTALSGKAAATTTISAGSGLTGGGNLTTNRALAVNFGQAAGTVCQGDDPRLANQRTPADNSVTNAKIPAGANIDPTKLGAGRVVGSVNGTPTSTTIWRGTQAQYEAKGADDPNTVYVVKG
jgi:hypothetical protein